MTPENKCNNKDSKYRFNGWDLRYVIGNDLYSRRDEFYNPIKAEIVRPLCQWSYCLKYNAAVSLEV